MEELKFLIEGAKVAGVSVFLFILFYYYMKKQFETFEKAMEDQRQRDRELLDATVQTFKHIVDKSDNREDRHFAMLSDQTETLQHFAGTLARIEHKIDTSVYKDKR